MKTIHGLIPDIYQLIGGKDDWLTDIRASDLGADIASALQTSFGRQERRTLRLSQMGPKCPCALWHSIHTPLLAEPIPPYAHIKYAYGHIIEHFAISLAKAAGHEVTGEQDELTVDGVHGHRDCVIDGCIVDVKSSTTYSFQKFKDKTIAQDDTFGYLDQLDGYLVGSMGDPLVRVKDKAYLLAVDKTLGHMVIYEHRLREASIRQRISDYKRIVSANKPPRCECGVVPDGKSGNLKLDTKASYSPFRHVCHPSLRTFLYSSGPVYLTHVARKPDVMEVDKNGKRVYN